MYVVLFIKAYPLESKRPDLTLGVKARALFKSPGRKCVVARTFGERALAD